MGESTQILIRQLSDDEFEAEVVDWGDIDTLTLTLGGVEYKFERGKDDPQFYTQGEMEALGEKLIQSESNIIDIIKVVDMTHRTVRGIASR